MNRSQILKDAEREARAHVERCKELRSLGVGSQLVSDDKLGLIESDELQAIVQAVKQPTNADEINELVAAVIAKAQEVLSGHPKPK